MKATFRVEDMTLVPADQDARDALKKQKSVVIIDLKRSRNPAYHARAFTIFRVLYDMIETELLFDPWRKMMTIQAGYFSSTGSVLPSGIVTSTLEAKSLAFENMEQEDFEDCFKAVHQAFVTRYGDLLTYDQLTEWSRM